MPNVSLLRLPLEPSPGLVPTFESCCLARLLPRSGATWGLLGSLQSLVLFRTHWVPPAWASSVALPTPARLPPTFWSLSLHSHASGTLQASCWADPPSAVSRCSASSALRPLRPTLPRPHPDLAAWPSAPVLLCLCLTCPHRGGFPPSPPAGLI